MAIDFFQQHQPQLEKAIEAIANREFYAAYPEVPSGKIYGENARKDGQRAFEGRIGSSFDLQQCGTEGSIGNECSLRTAKSCFCASRQCSYFPAYFWVKSLTIGRGNVWKLYEKRENLSPSLKSSKIHHNYGVF